MTRSAVVMSARAREQDLPERAVPSRSPGKQKRRDSEPPLRSLTPYQARLDVDMDSTAISKVRDPSTSIRLGPGGDIVELDALGRSRHADARPELAPAQSPPAAVQPRISWGALVLGLCFGVLVVALTVAFTRW